MKNGFREFFEQKQLQLDNCKTEQEALDIGQELIEASEKVRKMQDLLTFGTEFTHFADGFLEDWGVAFEEEYNRARRIADEIAEEIQEIARFGSYEEQHRLRMRDVL